MNFFYAALIGALAGMIGSMGLGGGGVLLLYLTAFLSYEQLTAQGINLAFFIPIAILAILLHRKSGLTDMKFALKAAVTGVPGVLLGVWLAYSIPSEWLSKAFAGLLLLLGIKELFHKKKSGTDPAKENGKNAN